MHLLKLLATSPALLCSGYQVAVDVAEALVFLHTQLRVRHGGLSSR